MSNHAERQPAKAGSNQPTTQRQVQPSGQTSRMQQLADHSPQALQLKQQTEAITPPNRTGLPNQLKSGIESLSGMSMDHVKVHYNSSKPAQLQAHAYAQGSDIHVGPGQERHLPHEAWHVVQQAQGRVQPTVQMKTGVAINDDRHLEADADAMGELALRIGQQDRPQPQAGAHAVHQRRVVQRVAMGERPFKDGYASVTSHPTWAAKAEAYEKKLGVYAYSHGAASAAVGAGLNRMETMLGAYYSEAVADATEKSKLYSEVFTKDDAGSAGQIGTEVDFHTISTMLSGGNLRERMTAFYNAAYFNSNPNMPLRGFKTILNKILFEDQIQLAQTLGLNEVELKEKALFLKNNVMRQGLKSLTSWTSKGYNFEDDPFALGNLTLAQELRGTTEMGLSQYERVPRPASEYDGEKRSSADYENLGLGLSDREKAYTAKKMSTVETAPDYSAAKLPWLEGHTYYKMEKGTPSWIGSVRDTLHMPVVAGVSGTTTRMLSAYKWLNGADPENFRLALMGWMLPAWDHSLYEIMRGSHLAGVKPAGDSDLSDVVDMYMNVAPLSKEELRNNVATDKQFPHEEIYMERMKVTNSNDADAFTSAHENNKTEATNRYNLHGATNVNMSKAHSAAIYNYTSGIHSMMNAALSMPGPLAKKWIRSKLISSAHYACRHAWLAARYPILSAEELAEYNGAGVETIDTLNKGNRLANWLALCASYPDLAKVEEFMMRTVDPWIDTIIESVYEEMKVHTNMTVEGMKTLPPVNGIDVWRGDWTSMFSSIYEKGKTIKHDTLTSYSKKRATALGFVAEGATSYKVLIKLSLKGKGGRDIDNFSKYPEDEVLMMPGSEVKITDVAWGKDLKKDLKLCTAEEI